MTKTTKTETTTVRKHPTPATLYKHLTAFIEEKDIDPTLPTQLVLDLLKDAIVAEAIK